MQHERDRMATDLASPAALYPRADGIDVCFRVDFHRYPRGFMVSPRAQCAGDDTSFMRGFEHSTLLEQVSTLLICLPASGFCDPFFGDVHVLS